MKKTLSVILVAAIMLTLVVFLPTTAEAKKSGDFVYTVTDGKAEITSYLGSESELVIPSDFDGVPVTSIGSQSFKENQSLTSVIIPDTVLTIGGSAFEECNSLKNLIIGNSVTTINGYAFCCCYNLTNITFPNSLRNIGYVAFLNTSWLDSQPEGIVYAGNVVYTVNGVCPAEIELKEGTTGIAESAFWQCNNLNKIVIPDSVTDIGVCSFGECKALESVTLGNSVRSIAREAFYNCVSLENITIPKSVEIIDSYAFGNCVSLEKATILTQKTIVYDAFGDCKSLTIYGYRNSTAESYANRNNIPFVPLDGEATTEPTTQAITEPTTQAITEPTTQGPTVAPSTEPTSKTILGDIDGDGKVTITDATLIQKYLAEYELPYPIGEPIE